MAGCPLFQSWAAKRELPIVNWQEYQEAVGRLYEQMEGIGNVQKSITIPDKITKQPRQIDVWLELNIKSHKIGILIDAKFRKEKIDVKDIEEVLALANAVGANKSVLVALNGWTEPAQLKAEASGLDLRLWTLEQALDLIVPDKWVMCPVCENDCIVLEYGGGFEFEGRWSLLSVGQCRECRTVLARCWACGDEIFLKKDDELNCSCGHHWKNDASEPLVRVYGDHEWISLSKEAIVPDAELIRLYTERGFHFRQTGDLQQAIFYLSKVIDLLPIVAKAYFNRAYTFDEYGFLEQAISDYTKAIEIEPDFAMAYGSRGIAYYASGRLVEAVSDLEEFLLLNPEAPDRLRVEEAIRVMKTQVEI